jgi:hypothetical protein
MCHSLAAKCRWSQVSNHTGLLEDIYTAVKNNMPDSYHPVNNDWRKKAYNVLHHGFQAS